MVTCLMLTLHPIQQRIWLLLSIASSTFLGYISFLVAALPRWTHRQMSTPISVQVLKWGRRHHSLLFFFLCFTNVRTFLFGWLVLFSVLYWLATNTGQNCRGEKVTESSQVFSCKTHMGRALMCCGNLRFKLVPGSSRAVIWITAGWRSQ